MNEKEGWVGEELWRGEDQRERELGIALHKLDAMVHVCNPSAVETDTRELELQGYPQGYVLRSSPSWATQ